MPDVQSLLFDPVGSNLPLLDLTNKRLLEEIYRDNGSGWIKIGVVRDPLTRLLSAYLDLVHTWSFRWKSSSSHDHGPQQPHRGLWADSDWEWFEVITRRRSLAKDEVEQQKPKAREHQTPLRWSDDRKGGGGGEDGSRSRRLQDSTVPAVPTFEELIHMLEDNSLTAPSALRPAASLCGMQFSPFDTIIPFETLQVCIKGLQYRWSPCTYHIIFPANLIKSICNSAAHPSI